jgi:ADP-ribose pyrophosphatase YjhB (NUDIX family)
MFDLIEGGAVIFRVINGEIEMLLVKKKFSYHFEKLCKFRLFSNYVFNGMSSGYLLGGIDRVRTPSEEAKGRYEGSKEKIVQQHYLTKEEFAFVQNEQTMRMYAELIFRGHWNELAWEYVNSKKEPFNSRGFLQYTVPKGKKEDYDIFVSQLIAREVQEETKLDVASMQNHGELHSKPEYTPRKVNLKKLAMFLLLETTEGKDEWVITEGHEVTEAK